MTHTVFVEEEASGYRATPLSLPDAAVTAPTREAAVRAVAHAIASRLAHGELIQVEVPTAEEDPLVATAGIFADDPDYIRRICAEAYAARDAEEVGVP